jgi:hypothetical protein
LWEKLLSARPTTFSFEIAPGQPASAALAEASVGLCLSGYLGILPVQERAEFSRSVFGEKLQWLIISFSDGVLLEVPDDPFV